MIVTIYSKDNCSYCVKAIALADREGLEFQVKKLGTDFDALEMFETFPTARTFPQIIVDGEKIGGYMEFEKLVEKRQYFDSDFEEQCKEIYGDNMPDLGGN